MCHGSVPTKTKPIPVRSLDLSVPKDLNFSLPTNTNITASGPLQSNNQDDFVVTEKVDTTTFHHDANPVSHSIPNLISLPSSLLSSASDGVKHSLESFFERPQKIGVYSWSSTAGQASYLNTINIPYDAISNDFLTSKLKGFLGFRAKTRIRLVLNANRFQQGRLIMNFFPQNDVNVARQQMTNFASNGINSLVYATQLPRVELDINTDTEAVLEIPYATDNLYFNLISGEGSAGIVNVIVYSPLVDPSGSGSVDYTLFVEFEQVQLVYPTFPSTLFVQSGGITTFRKKRGASSSETKSMGISSMSDTLGAIAGITKAVATVPLLSSIATPVSWLLSASANAAKAWGFSKPTNIGAVTYVNNNPFRGAINVDCEDNSYPTGLFADNEVQHLPGFAGVDSDEMSIPDILAISCFFNQGTWTTSQAQGTQLLNLGLAPQSFGLSSTGNVDGVSGVAIYHDTPVRYLSNAFSRYRGSFKITVKFIKTEFHSGRLMFTFGAGNKSTGDINFLNTPYTHRDIVDIRECSEYSFTCPYSSTLPYLNTGADSNYFNYYGYFTIWILNELIAPSTVSQTVSLLYEVSCCEDFEFAVPKPIAYFPYSAYTSTNPATYFPGPNPGAPPVVVQSGDAVSAVTENARVSPTENPIGSSKVVSDSHSSSALCIGEKILSLRQLLKRSLLFANFTLTPAIIPVTSVGTYIQEAMFYPHSRFYVTPSNSVSQTYYFDYIDYFAPMFGLFRGSMRFKVNSFNNGNPSVLKSGTYNPFNVKSDKSFFLSNMTTQDGTEVASNYFSSYLIRNGNVIAGSNDPQIPISDAMNDHPEFVVPYYCSRHCSVNTLPQNPNGSSGGAYCYYHSPQNAVVLRNTIVTSSVYELIVDNTHVKMSRSIGEDFSFGYFLGTVPIVDAANAPTYCPTF